MRAIIQRTEQAKILVETDGEFRLTGEMMQGLLVLLGVEKSDTEEDVDYLIRKIKDMRIFNDSEGKMNLSLIDINGSIGIVSQFTLHANTKKGNRPSFIRAADPVEAEILYKQFINKMELLIKGKIISGVFGAMMKIDFINDGPVTIIIDSKQREL
ncbi:MAG: D-tyrosyl-tRNA(Tyr) deacylase [Saprospirales bacterium]|nr:MAG: D-tyrosyl-tRNA(Tyr) deacylase [Saprospirales bacterium]